jgi:hypothetical protein
MNYNEYLENIKKKLDSLNRASGVNPEADREIKRQMQQSEMPSNEIFDMLGNGAKLWMEKNKNQNSL